MSSKNLYRIGGITAILSVLLTLVYIFTSDADGNLTELGSLFYRLSNFSIILVAWVLYHLYSSVSKRLSLAALILSIAGTALPFLRWKQGSPMEFVAIFVYLGHIVPLFLFGILAYRHVQLGMPRSLGVVGILYTIISVVFYILYRIMPEDFDLGIIGYIPQALNLVWLAWTGFSLLFGKPQESSETINIWGVDKFTGFLTTSTASTTRSKIVIGSIVALLIIVAVSYMAFARRNVPVEIEIASPAAETVATKVAETVATKVIEDSKVISVKNADRIKQLNQWYEGEINGTIDDWFFNADGTLAGINTPYGIYLIDLNADSVTHLLPDEPYKHRLKGISPDGKFLVTEDNESQRMRNQGDYRQTLYLWDVARQEIIKQMDVGIDYAVEQSPYPYLNVIALTFSPDGNEIMALIDVSDSTGEAVKSFVWNMPDGQLVTNQPIESSQRVVDLVTSNFGYGSLPTIEDRRNSDSFVEVHFLPSGDQIAIAGIDPNDSFKSVTVLSFPEGNLVSKTPLEEYDVRIAATGNKFITVKRSGDTEYATWALPNGDPISTFTVRDSNSQNFTVSFDSPYSYTISSTGDLLAGTISSDGNIAIVKNDGTTLIETSLSGKVLTFSPRDDYIVVHNGVDLMFVNTSTGSVSKTIHTIQPVGGLAVHPTEDLMAVSHPDSLEVYQTSTRKLVTSLPLKNKNTDETIPPVSFSSDGTYLISQRHDLDSDLYVKTIWNTSDWSLAGEVKLSYPGSASDIFLLQDQPLLVTTSDSQLQFFDIKNSVFNEKTYSTDSVYSADATYGDMVDFKISPDQKYLAYYGTYQGTPQFVLFDLSKVATPSDLQSAMDSPVLSYPVEWVGEGSTANIAFSPQSDFLAVYDIEFSIYVINLTTLEVKWKINDSFSHNSLVFSPDSNLLIADGPIYDMNDESTTDENGNLTMGWPPMDLPIAGDFIGISNDGKLLISASKDGVITYWGIP